MRLNLLAGVANSAWTALVMLAVVPLYLKYLGIEAYGLIGFFATTQALLQLLDMGLAPTINREVARASASGNLSESGELLHTLAIIYWTVAGLIALGIFTLAPVIADYWLRSNTLSPQSVTHAVMLIGLVVACRWPVGLYQGAVIGAHRLAVSSAINITMVTIGSFGAVAVLAFVSPSIEAFFAWQAVIGLTHASIIRFAAWRLIGRKKDLKFDIGRLKHIWRFSAGMSGVTISALLLSQIDKVILSKLLNLEGFGQYVLATTVAGSLYIFINPVFNAIYPKFSDLVARGDTQEIEVLFKRGSSLLAVILFSLAVILVMGSYSIVLLWTGNSVLAQTIAPLVSIMAVGVAFHGVMYFPFALQIAYGQTRIPLGINTVLMIVVVPVTYVLVMAYGVLGGAIAWLVFHMLYLTLGTWATDRYLLRGGRWRQVARDIGTPLFVAAMVGFFGWVILPKGVSEIVTLWFSCIFGLLAFFISLLVCSDARMLCSGYLKDFKTR